MNQNQTENYFTDCNQLFPSEQDEFLSNIKNEEEFSIPDEISNMENSLMNLTEDIFKINQKNLETKITSKVIDNKLNKTFDKKEDKNIFKTFKFSKRGRPRTKSSRKNTHSNDSSDNILDKLKSHFISFLISQANDVANIYYKTVIYHELFKKIKYLEKLKYNPTQIRKLKYKDIFNLKISRKNKGIIEKDSTNKDVYDNVCNNSILLKEFFEQNYLDVFNDVYYKDKREYNFKGLKIKLSDRTKTFQDLLNKGLNLSIEKQLRNAINKFYSTINKKYDENINK